VAFTLGTESSEDVAVKRARFQATRVGNAGLNSFSMFLPVQIPSQKKLPPSSDAVPQPFTTFNYSLNAVVKSFGAGASHFRSKCEKIGK
jgi:hypothetical protein